VNSEEERSMNSKAALFSAIAILGTAWLLWAGYQGMSTEQRDHEEDEETEQVEEQPVVREHDTVRAITQRGDILSLERILQDARAQHAGRVLESELEQKDGRYIYEVELVDDHGRVWEMKFDARTGEVLREGQGD
jgi:uncharacterized membrane protein YkoI